MTTQLNAESIQRFMKGQVSAWNAHDREAFLDCYRQIAPESLVIEYAGRTDTRDGWFILEEMFDKHNADISLEVVETIYNGNDVAAHHRNCLNGTGLAIDSNTVFRLGSLSKGITAVLSGILVEEGLLNWQDKVVKYYPQTVG